MSPQRTGTAVATVIARMTDERHAEIVADRAPHDAGHPPPDADRALPGAEITGEITAAESTTVVTTDHTTAAATTPARKWLR
jgi:hypothetical protein